MQILPKLTRPQRILSIQVDAIYVEPSKKDSKEIEDTFVDINCNELNFRRSK